MGFNSPQELTDAVLPAVMIDIEIRDEYSRRVQQGYNDLIVTDKAENSGNCPRNLDDQHAWQRIEQSTAPLMSGFTEKLQCFHSKSLFRGLSFEPIL
jgi:hypothetical protein